MGKVYFKLFYHVVWSTYRREPIITPPIETILPAIFNRIALRFNLYIHAVGMVRDHIHIVLTVPPAMSVSDAVGKLKGSSSHTLGHDSRLTSCFSWQDGFGVRSISDRELPKIIHYVHNQRQHHGSGSTFPEYEMDHAEEHED